MSWLRTAVNKAVDTDHLIRRTIQSYAVHAGNAVAGGAKIFHHRIGFRNLHGFTNTVKRLEELSVSCRGGERVQLLRSWLVLLKQVALDYDNNSDDILREHPGFDESNDSPQTQTYTLVHYLDSFGDEPKNFRDVLNNSQALEGITLSMILEAPNKEEVPLVQELYGLCLTGGTEIHNAVLREVQDLSEAFSGYQEEVLIKRKELLQYAQAAIARLKINADLSRIDAEACNIKEKLSRTNTLHLSTNEGCDKTTLDGAIDLEQVLTEVQLCYKLEAVLLKKKSLNKGDSPEIHAEKVDKLKVLLESLSNSTSKAENRILDHRSQKEDALSFRAAKTSEVYLAEKDLEAEISQLETKRDELEAELKKVISSLASAQKRLLNAREEIDQFDEASNQILVHLKTKEDEVLRSVSLCRAEAEVVDSWISFLEHTWALQTSYTEQKEKQIMDELERLGDYFLSLVVHLLTAYKESLGPYITRTRKLVEGLRASQGSEIPLVEDEDDKSSKVTMPRKGVEEEYLDVEAKFLTAMSIMDSMKKQFYVRTEGIFRKDDQKIEELFEAIEKQRREFESIERPTLEIETLTKESLIPSNTITKHGHVGVVHSSMNKQQKKTTNDTESVITELDSEFDSDGLSDLAEDINDWEFDALVKD